MKNSAHDLFVNKLEKIHVIANKLNISTNDIKDWCEEENWKQERANKHKVKLLSFLKNKLDADVENSWKVFQSIFTNLDEEQLFTDDELFAGIKYIALYNDNEKLREFSKKVILEGGKQLSDIKLEILQSAESAPDIKTIYCPECGNLLNKDSKICPVCGSQLKQTVDPKATFIESPSLNNTMSQETPNFKNVNPSINDSEIYSENFDVLQLSREQIVQFKKHRFITKLHPAIPVLLNYTLIGLIVFFFYYLSLHSKLPKVNKTRDVSGGKAIGFCFIPIYNALYWYHSVWQRLIERINFQHKLRNSPYRISYSLVGFTTGLGVFPYLNLFSVFLLGPILFWKVQTSINMLINIDKNS